MYSVPWVTSNYQRVVFQQFRLKIYPNRKKCKYVDEKNFHSNSFSPISTTYFQTISIDLTTPRNGLGLINDHAMFHRFANVFDIQFIGAVSISPSYDEKENRKKLTKELFNLAKLENVRLEKWNQGDAFTWKFPNTIKSLQLIGHGYTQLDLSSYTNLRDLRLSENNLKTMPKLSFPPPPLENLDLSNNPALEITVYDIVELCELEELYLNKINVHVNETAKNCECKRLKKFMKEFRIDGTRFMHCSLESKLYKYRSFYLL